MTDFSTNDMAIFLEYYANKCSFFGVYSDEAEFSDQRLVIVYAINN